MLKPKNIAIFLLVAVVLVLIYIFFIKSDGEDTGLVSTSTTGTTTSTVPATTGGIDALDAKDFLGILLSVKSIKLDDSIFSDIAFSTLRDSSITLTPDGTEGRPNPFAPIGVDKVTAPVNTTTSSSTQSPAVTSPSTVTSGAPTAN